MWKKKTAKGPGVCLAVAVFLMATNVASAHSRPIRFDPAPGTILSAPPAQVTGWFTSDIRRDPNWSFIHVADADGNMVSTGDPVLSSDRRQMSIALKSALPAGAYTATWRTWDDIDGAIFGDCFNFFVGQAAADGAYSSKTRLDAGGKCERIDVEAKNGTPVPGETPTTSGSAAEDMATPDAGNAATSTKSRGVATWVLALGVIGGLVVGSIGGGFVGAKMKS